MNEELLKKILDSDISREVKDKILSYWLLPRVDLNGVNVAGNPPIQKTSDLKVGSIKRPSKQDLDYKNNPKLKETEEAMSETLDRVVEENDIE